MRTPLLLPLLLCFLPSAAQAQGIGDLLGRGTSPKDSSRVPIEADVSIGRERIDLRISPDVQALIGEPKYNTLKFGVRGGLDLICGSGDLRAYFQNLLSRETAEGYLEDLVDAMSTALIGSGTELFCTTFPTSCSILLNHNLSAGLKLKYHSDLCRTVEEAVLDGTQRGRAQAIHDCIGRKIRAGLTEDQAIRACRNEHPPIQGLDGRVVEELDLNQEIRKFLQFTEGGSQVLDAVTQNARITSEGVSSEPEPNAVAEQFERARQEYFERWDDAIKKAGSGSTSSPPTETLEALLPPGTPGITRDELAILSRRSTHEQRAFIESVSSSSALLSLSRQMNEVERKIEALLSTPTVEGNDENRKLLEVLLLRLSGERRRLDRLFRDHERLNRTLAAADLLIRHEILKARSKSVRDAAIGVRRTNYGRGTRAFGSSPQSSPARMRRGSHGPSPSRQHGTSCCNGQSGWGEER